MKAQKNQHTQVCNRLNYSPGLAWICIVWAIYLFILTCRIICWADFFTASRQKYPYASFPRRTVHKNLLFGQVLCMWLPPLTQHLHWSWQGKGNISCLSVGVSFLCTLIPFNFHLFGQFFHKSLIIQICISFVHTARLLLILFFIAMHFGKVGVEVPKWINFLQRVVQGKWLKGISGGHLKKGCLGSIP